jgi:purine-binding chemotaxis protein CheW
MNANSDQMLPLPESPEHPESEALRSEDGEWLKFVLDDQHYALNVSEVKEILCAGDITPVPGAPGRVLGVINVRGNIATVVDARRSLGLPERASDLARWVVILDIDAEQIGLLVDEVLEVEDLDVGNVESVPGDTAEAVYGVVGNDEAMTILLDARILLGLQRQRERAA